MPSILGGATLFGNHHVNFFTLDTAISSYLSAYNRDTLIYRLHFLPTLVFSYTLQTTSMVFYS